MYKRADNGKSASYGDSGVRKYVYTPIPNDTNARRTSGMNEMYNPIRSSTNAIANHLMPTLRKMSSKIESMDII